MSKEELRKEAQESYIKLLRQINCKQDYNCETYNDGYIAGAEPREKRIAELEAQIEIMKSCVNCRYCINEKCPWQPKGCGMKHWELKKVKEK